MLSATCTGTSSKAPATCSALEFDTKAAGTLRTAGSTKCGVHCSTIARSTVSHRDGVDSDEALTVILHKGLEAHGLEAIPQHVMHILMSLPLLLQPLL
jgi:hypothetical protein